MSAEKFANSVVVLGSVNMDLVASVQRLPIAGETLTGEYLTYFPGGKGANQAVAAARAGADCRLIGCLGDDAFASELLTFLRSAGVDTQHIAQAPGASGTALILLQAAGPAAGENSIVVIPGSNAHVSSRMIDQAEFAGALASAGAAVAQFEVPPAAIEYFFSRSKALGMVTILNTAPARPVSGDGASDDPMLAKECAHVAACLTLADVLVLNETELGFYANQACDESTQLSTLVSYTRHIRRHPQQIIVVTLGARGVFALTPEQVLEVPGINVVALDTTGAGDCFVGYLAAALSQGLFLDAALRLANSAAAASVQMMGAAPSMPLREQLD